MIPQPPAPNARRSRGSVLRLAAAVGTGILLGQLPAAWDHGPPPAPESAELVGHRTLAADRYFELLPSALAAANSNGFGSSNGNSNGNGNGGSNGNSNGNGNGGSNGNSNGNGNGGSNGNSNGNGNGGSNGNGNGGSSGNSNGNGNGGSNGNGNGGSNGNGNGGSNGNGNGGSNGNSNGNGNGGSNGNSNGNGNGGSNGNGNGGGSNGNAHGGNDGNGGGRGGIGGSGGETGGAAADASGGSAAGGSASSGNADAGSAPAGSVSAGAPIPGKSAVTAGVGRSADFAPGEVLVVNAAPDTLARARSLGFSLIEERPLAALGLSVLRLKTPAGIGSDRGLALLHQAMPELAADVDTLYQPYRAQAAAVPETGATSLPARDYGQQMIDWRPGPDCGGGFRIGMIDSAVRVESGMPASRRHQRSFAGDAGADADTAHGTAIAALLAAARDAEHPRWSGLLPGAELYAASVFERHGARSVASAVAIASAIDWMVANRVPVVNISLSGEANLLVALAARRAAENGTVLVAAAGNGGPKAPPAYPAAYADVIAVTAVDQTGAVFPGANQGDYIDVAAPGVRIWAPGNGQFGQYLTGTSFAAPFAAAVLSLEAMAAPGADLPALRRRLAAESRHLGAPGKNPVYGYGLVQAGAACSSAARVAQRQAATGSAISIPLPLPPEP